MRQSQDYQKNAEDYQKDAEDYQKDAEDYQKAAKQASEVARKISAGEKQVIDHLNSLDIEMERCKDPKCFNDACEKILSLLKMYGLMSLELYSDIWKKCGGRGTNN